jgi:hypothetical protein
MDVADGLFDPDLLDDEDPSEIDVQEEHDFYAQPENQEPQGPPTRRKSRCP